jgi:hypothetical protein
MKRDWLTLLLFDTKLIENSLLSEKEIMALTSYVKERKNYADISKEIGVTDERVRQLIENAIGKILLSIKNLLAKASLFQATLVEKKLLEDELVELKLRFQKNLDEEEKNGVRIKPFGIAINDVRFSIRAKKVLADLNIKYIEDLKQLSLKTLTSVEGTGIKTVEEIKRIAEEYGVNIT